MPKVSGASLAPSRELQDVLNAAEKHADRMKDQRIIKLVHLMLKATVVMPDGTRVAVQEGTPQGGPLSPLLSNIVLNEMDGELARRGLRFVRYADDCNIFVRSERAGQRVMNRSGDFWNSVCGSRSTRRKVTCASRTTFNFWAFGSAARRRVTKSPYFPQEKRNNG